MRKMSNSSFKGRPWTRPIIPTRWRHSRPNPLGLNFPILPQKPNQLSLRPCGNPRPRPPHTLATGCGVKKGAVLVSAPIRGGVLIGREVTLLIATLITTGLVTMGTTSQNLHRPHKCHLAAVCNKTTFPPPTGSPNNKACRPFDPRPTGPHRVPPEILVPRSLHPTESPLRRALSDPHTTAHLPPTEPPT